MNEIWKIITNYKNYAVSNFGNVKNIKTQKILKQTTDAYGYLTVGLYNNGKQKIKKVHRLVAMMFLHDYSEALQVNHMDDNKKNNNISNLEMCTNKYNCNYGSRKNALSKPVLQYSLDGKLIKEWPSIRELERQTGYKTLSISSCCKGFLKDWKSGIVYPVHKAYGFIWKYKN